MTDEVKTLITRAAAANEPTYAMQYAQAALNAAHALSVLNTLKLPPK